MGYTIAMRCRNEKLQRQMTKFMNKNYRGWSKVSNHQKDDYSRFASNLYQNNSRLSYDQAKRALGFDYNACEPERDYIFAVTRWMALKIGSKKNFKGLGLVPFYVYDGGQDEGIWPILVEDEWKDKVPKKHQWCLTKSTGFRTMEMRYVGTPLYDEYEKKGKLKQFYKIHFTMVDEVFGDHKIADEMIKNELERLDRLFDFCCR